MFPGFFYRYIQIWLFPRLAKDHFSQAIKMKAFYFQMR